MRRLYGVRYRNNSTRCQQARENHGTFLKRKCCVSFVHCYVTYLKHVAPSRIALTNRVFDQTPSARAAGARVFYSLFVY